MIGYAVWRAASESAPAQCVVRYGQCRAASREVARARLERNHPGCEVILEG